MTSFFSMLSVEDQKKFLKIRENIEKNTVDPEVRWSKAILMDKALVHNLYLNMVLEYFGPVGALDIHEMITDSRTAFSPCEQRKIGRMVTELGIQYVNQFINSLFYIKDGMIICRKFRIERAYLEIKTSLYEKHHRKEIQQA